MSSIRALGVYAALMASMLLLPAGAAAQDGHDRIYGRVTTTSGRVYEGFIRWDRNEGSWADLLNGSKTLPLRNREEAQELLRGRDGGRERSVEFLGLRISWDDDEEDWAESAESGIRFGHVSRLVVDGDDEALLELKSGELVELRGGSTDIGDELRGLFVDDPDRGTVELEWRDLDEVAFMAPPASARPASARLYGTVVDRWGNEYTGFVAWDLDEVFTSDVLDGEEDGRDREIPFDDIVSIERESRDGARVRLRNGEDVVLRDSNDVDRSNRGIQVADPGLGQVQLGWDEFESIRFAVPPRTAGYDAFDGGHRLRGTVITEGGRRFTGFIRWDNDEEHSWEILDGRFRDVVYDVEFGQIASIRKRSTRSAVVTLVDGRSYELEDSNDVDRDNKGIFVTDEDGETVAVTWDDFDEVLFEHR